MAAYAALISLTNVIDQLQHYPRPPISVNNQQVESLTQNITFLEDFLDTHNGVDSEEGLASRIANAAYEAEDIIELHIVDQILDGSTSEGRQISPVDLYEGLEKVDQILDGSTSGGRRITPVDLYAGLQKVNEDIDSIKKDSTKVKPKQRAQERMDLMKKEARELKQKERAKEKMQSNTETTVGMDDALREMMDMLVRGSLNRDIIPITGMGGIGKTTLARNLYRHQTIVQHFHFLAWATISQEYTMKEIVLQLLGNNESGKMNEDELGKKLYKELSVKRYLIIIDDIWEIKIWAELKHYFPDNNNGSRVVLTTRLSKLASEIFDSNGLKLRFLNEDQIWDLFCKTVFYKKPFPLELEKIGRQIVESYRGLPLSINVIGGHLAMSAQTTQYWESIAENVSSVVNLEGNEHCLKILYTSYNSLPLHLKPCFLYMGGFREDSEINASHLIRIWVAEGFLKPNGVKSLEDIGEECLTELVERNLILVEEHNYYGKVKSFRMHDLLRDICLREARKQKFLYLLGVLSVDASQQRRIWTSERTILGPLSVTRSLIWKHELAQLPRFGVRLLRLYETDKSTHQDSLLQHLLAVFKRVNLRYINIGSDDYGDELSSQIPSSISLLWNLQTLVLFLPFGTGVLPFEMWKFPQLRHVKIHWVSIELPNDDDFFLENLQTLVEVQNLKFGEEMVKKIPNLKKLRLYYSEVEELRSHDFNLNNIRHLTKLNSLNIDDQMSNFLSEMQSLVLPNSLKKLTLCSTSLQWELMTEMVGSLPLLEVLRLRDNACMGHDWVTVEDQLCSLKLLEINWCSDLEYWETESSHFPRLEHVVLYGPGLKEIPSSLGDITTLRSIRLFDCPRSTLDSADRIREKQQELGNLDLQFHF